MSMISYIEYGETLMFVSVDGGTNGAVKLLSLPQKTRRPRVRMRGQYVYIVKWQPKLFHCLPTLPTQPGAVPQGPGTGAGAPSARNVATALPA